MSTHKNIDRICIAAIISAVIICILFMNGASLGIQNLVRTKGYEETLFDTSKVHTIDIEMDDWDGFIAGCEDEEYVPCTIVIDNDACKNVGIRAKGNTSLRTVSQLNSQRYSFKIEFDHYQDGKNYNGLDKLSLNNIIQDNTYMKDYLSYQMMNAFEVDAPLCSYVWITVNGEDWGLYLAVEGIEDSFLERNYGSEEGALYKPDSMSQGGGRGNGQDFEMDELNTEESTETTGTDSSQINPNQSTGNQQGSSPLQMPNDSGGNQNRQMPDNMTLPDNIQMPENMTMPDNAQMPENSGEKQGGNMFDAGNQGGQNGGGMGSDDVKLRYIDDNASSYSNIFDNAKTAVSTADQNRLIASLKSISENQDIENAVNTEEVLRYFVVHNYVVNSDSYTGQMVHNYYLYENDGQLSMIPWDYNLAFGGFQGGNASSAVNDAIDTPLSVSDNDDRPMFTWITKNADYLNQYHAFYSDFLKNVDVQTMIDEAYQLIKDYVNQDPTKFCTTEEFETGVSTLKTFCQLRTQSITGQLTGTIPSTDEGQSADSSKLIDASSITLSDMGSMNAGGGMDPSKENAGSGTTENTENVQTVPKNGQNMPSDNLPESGTNQNGSNLMPPDQNSEMINGQNAGNNTKQMAETETDRQSESAQSQAKPSDGNNSASDTTSTFLLLCVSLLILTAGLVFALKVK